MTITWRGREVGVTERGEKSHMPQVTDKLGTRFLWVCACLHPGRHHQLIHKPHPSIVSQANIPGRQEQLIADIETGLNRKKR